jgi:hypothetical protein
MWYLVNPPTGTNLAGVVTLGLPGGTGTVGVVVGATTFTGVDQTVPVRSFVSADGAATSTFTQLDVASGPGEMVIDTLAIAGNVTPTVTVPQVLQWGRTSAAANANPDVYGLGSTRRAQRASRSRDFLRCFNLVYGRTLSGPYQRICLLRCRDLGILQPPLTYTVTVTNNGTSSATGVVLTDTLAAGLTLVQPHPARVPAAAVLHFLCPRNTCLRRKRDVTVIGTPTARGIRTRERDLRVPTTTRGTTRTLA